MPWSPGHTLCPWHLIFTHDGLRVQRTISLPYKDTSTCCFVKFISSAAASPSLLKPIASCPQCDGGTGYFARARRESEGPTFFAEILSILCWECCWLLHPGLVWVIVPGRERLVPCQLQLSAWVWMNNKEIYKTSWNKGPGSLLATLSFPSLTGPYFIHHPMVWPPLSMEASYNVLECCFQRWKKDSANWLRL